jgi:hypothetical protein
MTRELCSTLPPDWFEPASDGARHALGICRSCPSRGGCLVKDPTPHGVIRAGNAYSDTGRILPICSNCGYPDVGYRGGDVTVCRRCAVPDVPIPADRGAGRLARIAQLVSDGQTDEQIAAEFGMAKESLRKLRTRHGIRRRRGPARQAAPEIPSGADVDEEAVERALSGEHVRLSDFELVAAVQAGRARGLSVPVLSERLGTNEVAARRLLNSGLPPRRARHAAVVASLRADPHRSNAAIGAEVGVGKDAVRRARLHLDAEVAS